MNRDVSILIVGGGIGGLTVGAALKAKGFHPTIVERAENWAPVGAGIVLGINAMQVADRLGLTGALVERGRVLDTMQVSDYRGETLNSMSLDILRERHGPSITIHRAKLHEALLTAHSDTAIWMGTSLTNVAGESGLELNRADGTSSTHHFDIVVGADGIRSTVRDQLFPKTSFTYSGYTCWRFVANDVPEVTETCEMWGKGRRFGVVPLPNGQVYCFSTLNAAPNDPSMKSVGWPEFKELFGEFGGDVPKILDSIDDDVPLIHGDLEQVYLPRWFSDSAVLLGDAAHAMTPNMGQGAAMAIEDAWVLAECLAEEGTVGGAFDRYQKRRQPRVNSIQHQSWQIGKIAQWEGALPCFVRNTIMKWVPNKGAMKSLEKLLTQEL